MTGNQKGPREPEPEPFNPIEQASGRAFRSYRVEGIPKTNPDAFFELIRKGLIELISRELNDLRSARVQTTM